VLIKKNPNNEKKKHVFYFFLINGLQKGWLQGKGTGVPFSCGHSKKGKWYPCLIATPCATP